MTLPSSGSPDRLALESAAFFAYGPLAFPEVMQVFLARVPVSYVASVAGWRVVAASGPSRAGLVRAEAVALGSVIFDLSNSEWQLLDAFQAGCELRLLGISDGTAAWCYVCADQRLASAEDWDAAIFEKDDLVAHLKSCAEWRRRHQTDLNSDDVAGHG